MTKRKLNKSEGWRPVTLDSGVLFNGAEGLVGIEELTDYRLEKSGKRVKILIADEKSKKRTKPIIKSVHTTEDETNTERKSKLQVSKRIQLKERQKKQEQVTKSTEIKCSEELNSVEDTSDLKLENIDDINISQWSSLGVPNVVIRALADQKYYSPTTIQSLTITPAILGRRDILGAAETGSGKTLAFGIPIINGILELKRQATESLTESLELTKDDDDTNSETEDSNAVELDSEREENTMDSNGIGCVRVIDNIKLEEEPNISLKKPLYALILTPTRELAIQIKDHLIKAAKYTDIKIAVVVGGMAAVKQERILSKGPEIVIATPGRLWELMQQGNAHLNQLNSIRFLAIDETDRMLEKGHFQELHTIIERINANQTKAQKRQTFVFSATLTMVHDIPDYLKMKKKKYGKSKIFKLTPGQKLQKIIEMLQIKNPKVVDITKEKGTAGTLTECRIACTIDHKDYYLYYFLKRHSGRTLVFCNSIGCVKRLAALFSILQCNPLPLHASMQQRQRLKNLERFQVDENGLLIATDVAARGLDIPNVEHVIHYQVPRTSEGYVHRSGRTARAQKEGLTLLMMEPSEKQNYTKLCQTLGRTEDLPVFPVIDRLLVAVKARVNIAREIDSLELKCKRNNLQKGWLEKAAEDMDILLDDDQLNSTMESKELANLRRELKIKKNQLSSMLAKPLFPKGFSGKYLEFNLDYNLGSNNGKAVDIVKRAIEEAPKKSSKPKSVKTKKPIKRLKEKKKKNYKLKST